MAQDKDESGDVQMTDTTVTVTTVATPTESKPSTTSTASSAPNASTEDKPDVKGGENGKEASVMSDTAVAELLMSLKDKKPSSNTPSPTSAKRDSNQAASTPPKDLDQKAGEKQMEQNPNGKLSAEEQATRVRRSMFESSESEDDDDLDAASKTKTKTSTTRKLRKRTRSAMRDSESTLSEDFENDVVITKRKLRSSSNGNSNGNVSDTKSSGNSKPQDPRIKVPKRSAIIKTLRSGKETYDPFEVTKWETTDHVFVRITYFNKRKCRRIPCHLDVFSIFTKFIEFHFPALKGSEWHAECDENWIEDLEDWKAVKDQFLSDSLRLTPFLELVIVNESLPMKCVYAPKAVLLDDPFHCDYPPEIRPPPMALSHHPMTAPPGYGPPSHQPMHPMNGQYGHHNPQHPPPSHQPPHHNVNPPHAVHPPQALPVPRGPGPVSHPVAPVPVSVPVAPPQNASSSAPPRDVPMQRPQIKQQQPVQSMPSRPSPVSPVSPSSHSTSAPMKRSNSNGGGYHTVSYPHYLSKSKMSRSPPKASGLGVHSNHTLPSGAVIPASSSYTPFAHAGQSTPQMRTLHKIVWTLKHQTMPLSVHEIRECLPGKKKAQVGEIDYLLSSYETYKYTKSETVGGRKIWKLTPDSFPPEFWNMQWKR